MSEVVRLRAVAFPNYMELRGRLDKGGFLHSAAISDPVEYNRLVEYHRESFSNTVGREASLQQLGPERFASICRRAAFLHEAFNPDADFIENLALCLSGDRYFAKAVRSHYINLAHPGERPGELIELSRYRNRPD